MAMYPFNKVAQFGKIVDIVDSQGQRHRCGGIITFTVTKPPQKTTFKTLSNKPPQFIENDDYYKKTEEGYKPGGAPQPPPNPVPGGVLPITSYFSMEDILLYLVLPVFVIFVIIMVVKIMKTDSPDQNIGRMG
jgi:hypothetical protein